MLKEIERIVLEKLKSIKIDDVKFIIFPYGNIGCLVKKFSLNEAIMY